MTTTTRKLALDDIADVRAYERERDTFRPHVIELKRRRRVHLGTVVTFVFENRDTIRFQIQEMARVEKLISDADIQVELDTYNPMVPDPGQVCATMFIELTSDDQMREWLPKLVEHRTFGAARARRTATGSVASSTSSTSRASPVTTSPPRCTTCAGSSRPTRSRRSPAARFASRSTIRPTWSRSSWARPPTRSCSPTFAADR